MPSLTPRLYPMPYPTTQAATAQPNMNSQIRPGFIVQCNPNSEPAGTDLTCSAHTDPSTTRPANRA